MIRGIITKSTGSWYEVNDEKGKTYTCRILGKFRTLNIKTSNPLAVGDFVYIKQTDKDYMIVDILQRKNYILRQSPKHKHALQIVASNIDQAYIMVTISNPRTSTGFIDRFLTLCATFNIPVYILFNKQDIYTKKDIEKQKIIANIYQLIGYKCFFLSVKENKGIDALKQSLVNKTSLLFGHSGVGKSSLMNQLDISLNLRTQEISKKFKKGLHTTTFAQMHSLPFGGYLIDTPGIKELGLTNIAPYELSYFFIDFSPYISQCKYNNCTHNNEPNCMIKKQVNKGYISAQRYKNYLGILKDIKNKVKHWE